MLAIYDVLINQKYQAVKVTVQMVRALIILTSR